MSHYTFASFAAIVDEAGKNNSLITNANSAAILQKFSQQAEATINALTRYDWVTNYSSVGANFKDALMEAEVAYAAKKVVKWDMSGYTNQSEALNVINICEDNFRRIIDWIREEKNRSVIV